MYFPTAKPDVVSTEPQSDLFFLEHLVRAAHFRFAALRDGFGELHAELLPTATARNSDGNDRSSRAHSLARATDELMAAVAVLDRMTGELLLESKQLRAATGPASGNVHTIDFERSRLRGSRSRNDRSATARHERVKRMSHSVISLLELAATLEESIANLQTVRNGARADNG